MYALVLTGIQGLVFVGVTMILFRRPLAEPSRQAMASWLAIGTVALTFEYWGLGPWSYVTTLSELEYGLPVYQYLANAHDGGQFSHAIAGGTDISGTFAITGQLVSLEQALVATFPLWLAQALHKLMLAAVALIGPYLLCRRVGGCHRLLAGGIALIHAVAHEYLSIVTWSHGLGYGIIPLAVYLLAFRIRRRGFWIGVVAIAGLNAVSSSVPHSNMALFPALALALFLRSPRDWPRGLLAISLVAIATIANWHDSILAMAAIGPLTFRGHNQFALPYWSVAFSAITGNLKALAACVGISACCLLFRGRWSWIGPGIGVVALTAGPLANMVPWGQFGLGILSGLNMNYIVFAFPAVAIAGFAVASRSARRSPLTANQLRRMLPALAVAAGLAGAVQYKAMNLSAWLSLGGLPVTEQPLLADPAWKGSQPVRVISVPYRQPSNLAWSYGLHTLDGNINLLLDSLARYWRDGVLRHDLDMASGFVTIETSAFDGKCCQSYNLDTYVRADFLRIANVGFVLSKLPLTGAGIRQVAGPSGEETGLPRSSAPLAERMARYFKLALEPEPLRVYALGQQLPRVYAATGVDIAKPSAVGEIEQIGDVGLGRRIVVGTTAGLQSEAAQATFRVLEFTLPPDGVVASLEAPDGGVVVVNIPWTPFWTAAIDGVPAKIVPANMIQMAISVPKGARELRMQYHRPTLNEKLIEFP